jgi:hypothetical protein
MEMVKGSRRIELWRKLRLEHMIRHYRPGRARPGRHVFASRRAGTRYVGARIKSGDDGLVGASCTI